MGQNVPVARFEWHLAVLGTAAIGKVAAATHEVLVPLGEGRRMRVHKMIYIVLERIKR